MNATTAAMMLFIHVLSAMTSSITVTAFATWATASADSAVPRSPVPNKNMNSLASMPRTPTITIIATTAAPTLPAVNAARETGLEKMATAAPDSRSW